MEKELIILSKDYGTSHEEQQNFNRFNKKYKIFYNSELDSIDDFEKNKNELITIEPFHCIYNHLTNVLVQEIKDISDIEKKINVFNLSGGGDLLLNVHFGRKDSYKSRGLLTEREDFNKIKTLDEVKIVFFFYYHFNISDDHDIYSDEFYDRCELMLLDIKKNNGKPKSKTVITPKYDLVGV